MKILGDRIMIKPYKENTVDEGSGMTFRPDDDNIPSAVVVMVSEELKSKEEFVNIPEVGDRVFYVRPREKGKCQYEDKDHYIIPIANIVAIL
ncbi:chaperonin Cpn10 [Cellulophaga phage Calle_1]|uniref:Chaperonin Cpn10 n=1 Tax=Cellulophaga phage Calle_1 TaxID=2745643 RepID=A0A8E4ZBB6_9CAUD|nr:chaperonin Cpn10 [Cellulophaga phage Calle_1]QQV89736.1 chaperonin Cpn10 [Cellulophaga phage Calle_1]QQV89853.1 chaperonin Cpn10 [Cellulophaga phage Calle_2]QQV89866.1 chaperonin Cpn10 [Cellulophaga phage Calle_3]